MTERLNQRDVQAQRAVRAAEGWLVLGAAQAALEELATLKSTCRQYPAVLHQRARALVALGRLSAAKKTIYRLARIAPERRLALLDDPNLESIWS